MVLYHILYDVVYIFGHPIGWYQSAAGYVWEQFICWSFILLSGFCFSLGSRPIKRGLLVFGAGCVISLVTMFVMPEQRVRFGILSLIGCCMPVSYTHLSELINVVCRDYVQLQVPLFAEFPEWNDSFEPNE